MNFIQLEDETKIEEEDLCEKDYVTEAAKNAFGITYLYPWQRIVIGNILEPNEANNRQIVLLPTGAGKSLCFLTPALLLNGPTLVIYPLLALMADQKRRMVDGSLKCVEFRGGQSPEEREDNFTKIRQGAQVIIANPEVLQSQTLVDRLCKCNIQHIAIDEAHCVSEWGDSFRPSYLELGKIIDRINPKVVTAFTATASPPVLSRISEVLFHGKSHVVKSDFDRPNIHYYVRNVYAKKREAFRLAVTEQKPLIIFCGTRAKSEDMARELSEYMGHDKLRFYHAGLEREEKTAVEDLVNKWIAADMPVAHEEMPIDAAKKRGAMALFGEKYGDVVRVITAGDVSCELCGGTHVNHTGEIIRAKINKEKSISSGIRRITMSVGALA